MAENQAKPDKQSNDALMRVAEKVKQSENVLIALSKDPSVDELAAAIGLTMMLDDAGKHATAIFSGEVPNALEFLEPEKTLEKDTNSLQDFIIALNKEKADHLRYKIEGDYVKVFITPYKATIDEKDLEFSHGDFNVDLVIAIDVSSTNDLDAALYEHGRIMHNASSINIAAGMPGNFGDIEWGDPNASSVSEMICELEAKLRGESDKTWLTKITATALLTGIVASTARFSNEKTSASAMAWAGKLMETGADQQLISANIMQEILPNQVKTDEVKDIEEQPEVKEDNSSLKIQRAEAEEVPEETATEPVPSENMDGGLEIVSKATAPVEEVVEGPVAAEEPVVAEQAAEVQVIPEPEQVAETAPVTPPVFETKPTPEQQLEQIVQAPGIIMHDDNDSLMSELASASNFSDAGRVDYSEEMAKELEEINARQNPAPQDVGPAAQVPTMAEQVEAPAAAPINYSQGPMGEMPAIVAPVPGGAVVEVQPSAAAPIAPEEAVPNGELVEAPLPMPDTGILPPPPPPFDPNQQFTSDAMPAMPAPVATEQQVAPVEIAAPVSYAEETPVTPVSMENVAPNAGEQVPVMPQVEAIQPAAPSAEVPAQPLGENPAMQDQVYPQTSSDPGAFQIPGA